MIVIGTTTVFMIHRLYHFLDDRMTLLLHGYVYGRYLQTSDRDSQGWNEDHDYFSWRDLINSRPIR